MGTHTTERIIAGFVALAAMLTVLRVGFARARRRRARRRVVIVDVRALMVESKAAQGIRGGHRSMPMRTRACLSNLRATFDVVLLATDTAAANAVIRAARCGPIKSLVTQPAAAAVEPIKQLAAKRRVAVVIARAGAYASLAQQSWGTDRVRVIAIDGAFDPDALLQVWRHARGDGPALR
jgi:hypothetical protein